MLWELNRDVASRQTCVSSEEGLIVCFHAKLKVKKEKDRFLELFSLASVQVKFLWKYYKNSCPKNEQIAENVLTFLYSRSNTRHLLMDWSHVD